MDKIVIIADDLTGGADTGVQFCAFFDETVLVPHDRVPNALGQTGEAASRAISIFTNSRTLEADIARKRLMSLAGRFSQSKPEWIYKKIDSCLRGNLGAEIEAIMDGLGFELSFIAPEDGNHLIVSGTTSAVTKRQIKELRQVSSYREIILTADQLADGDQRNTLLKKASGVAGILSADNVIIRIGSQANGRTAAGKPPRLPRAESVAGGIGIFVAAALKRCRPGFLFATGGDTANAILTALEGSALKILGEMVGGMVHGRLIGGPLNGLAMITKAGAFGKADALVVLHETWKKKFLGFQFDQKTGQWGEMSGVNITLGLPIVRTSVDHGTAFGKAGEGRANPQSMIEAIKLAAMLSKKSS